jgi:K+-transporting ATPase, KdpA
MNWSDWLQVILYLVILLAASWPLGNYMADVFEDRKVFLTPVLQPIENLIYKLGGVNATAEMNWKVYALAMLLFNIFGLIAVYALQRLQALLPLNPQTLGGVSADSSLNTAISFASNTNWQGYGGETTMSYLTQMLGLTVQNFVSAAAGIAVLIALVRGLVRRSSDSIGNFWQDMVRATLYVLIPMSIVLALLLISQGSVQTLDAYASYTPLEVVKDGEGKVVDKPVIALGPAASQIAIKQLGTNGGGFFNVNSSHPLENPTPISNFVEMESILIISAALCWTFGKMVGSWRQGAAILIAMTVIYVGFLGLCLGFEFSSNPAIAGIDGVSSGAFMEGKEARFGIVNSALWATATTAASNGSVNSMHDSFSPIGGLAPMVLMQLGEVIYGGVGSGLYGMLIFAIVAVFIAGLMVGRTPEYLGKKIESFEMKMASIVILIPPIVVLVGSAIAVSVEPGRSSVLNTGAHAFSEILYAFSSAGNNNGSAFAGLNANTVFYNYALGTAMFLARYWLAIPTLAIAGSMARKKRVPLSAGTMPTDSVIFVVLLIGVVLIVGALTFIPALALGPIVEQLQMTSK